MTHKTKIIITTMILSLISIFLWNTFIIFPFRVLVVFLHEICHAIAALITGGYVDSINVWTNESGVARTTGFIPIVASAGYLGSILIGSFLFYFSFRTKKIHYLSIILGCILLLFTILYVRNFFGIAFGIASAIIFFAFTIFKIPYSHYFMQFISVMCILYSLFDMIDYLPFIGTILGYNTFGMVSDANILANYFGIPALAIPIGIVWAVLSIIILLYTIKSTIKVS